MITTLTGPNTFMLGQELQRLTAEFVGREGDIALERLDASEVGLERIGEALTSLPFLSSTKMVQLRGGSDNKPFMQVAADLLAALPDSTELIVVEPKPDKRSSYYKYLKSKTEFREFNELDGSQLAGWLVSAATDRGGTLKPADARFIVDRVGTNQLLLSNELDKLLLYQSNINQAAISALTEATPQSTIFELLDAAFQGHTDRALALYDEQRALKVEPQQIIAILSWQLHILGLIKAAGHRSPETIASEAKVSPYTVKKSLAIAGRLRLADLQRLLSDLIEIDIRSKRQIFDLDAALRQYILKLAL